MDLINEVGKKNQEPHKHKHICGACLDIIKIEETENPDGTWQGCICPVCENP